MASITGLMASLETSTAPQNGEDGWREDKHWMKMGRRSSIGGLGEASESGLALPGD